MHISISVYFIYILYIIIIPHRIITNLNNLNTYIQYNQTNIKNSIEKQMDNLKISSIFPSSMSEISLRNQSQYQGTSMTTNKNQNQKLADYHIKINGPDIKYHESRPPNNTTQIDRLQKNNLINSQINNISQENVMPHPANIEYKDRVNGYDLNKDAFSQQEILKAFNIIDINKDNVITEDDLIFVLDYLKEEYTLEEVREMISMLCADNKHVTFQEFKKLGRGDIVPLAKIKINDKKRKSKAQILGNLEKSNLIAESPSFFNQCVKKDMVVFSKYQQSKKNTKVPQTAVKIQQPSKNKLFTSVPLRNEKQFKQRQQQFCKKVMTTISDIIENYQQFKQKYLNFYKISQLLEISVNEAKQLYSNSNSNSNTAGPKTSGQIDSLLVIIQAIVYSKINMIKKLQYCLEICNHKNSVSVNQLVYILQIIKGVDLSVDKKIKAIILSKNMKLDQDIPKNVAYQMVLEYLNKLIGFY